MINILALLIALAIPHNSLMVKGEFTAYCPDVIQCGKSERYGYAGYYTSELDYATNGGCYTEANISLYDLSILPNENVMVSCILASEGNVSYTVVYSLGANLIGTDNWSNGVQSSRVIEVAHSR